MTIEPPGRNPLHMRVLNPGDLDNLFCYLENLSPETRKRFGPHPFDRQSIADVYQHPGIYRGYIAQHADNQEIIAYFIIKFGYLESDCRRFLSYGIALDSQRDCTFAPSVADRWQSRGIGNALFRFMLADLATTDVKRIVLWGGVQADNEKAVSYYTRHGFRRAGQFTHNGENFDMILAL